MDDDRTTPRPDEEQDELPPGPFVKIYGSIVYSSIWLEGPATRLLWITLLAIADQNGDVRGSVRGIASIAKISPEECEVGLTVLESPDFDSKDPDHQGRRIRRMKGGWHILNFRRYREMRTPEQINAAERQRRFREKNRPPAEPTRESEQRHALQPVTPVTVTPEVEGEVDLSVVRSSEQPPAVSHIPTEISTEPGVRLVRMLNRGMQDNPAIGTAYNPVLATSGHTLEAVEKLRAAGIPLEFAEGWIYTLACGYKPRKLGDQIQSLTYLIPAVEKEWEGTVARVDAAAASKPAGAPTAPNPTPSTSNGTGPAKATRSGGTRTGDLKGEGIIVYGRIRDGIRTKIVQNGSDSGNHLEVIISAAVEAELSSPAKTALAAIGGPSAINRSTDESLSWKFAAAYAAAVTGNGSP